MLKYILYFIKYILIYNNYIKYISYININKEHKELVFLYSCLNTLHTTLQRDLSFEEYCVYVMHHCVEKDKETISSLLDDLRNYTAQDDLIHGVLEDIRNKQLAYELALVSLEVNEGRSSVDKIFQTLDNFDKKQTVEEITFVTDNLQELYNDSIKQPGLRWRLQTLNKMLGSLRKGDFGFIFARPETGKTTFLASEVTNFAQQVPEDRPILWCNNEEQGSKVRLRCFQAMLGCDSTTLFRDLQGSQHKYNDLGGCNVKIYDSASIHKRQVEQLCKELNPSLVIFDQIDKIKGFQDDREDLRLGSIYIWAREIAKQYCPVIGVSQADASGEGKRWLTMENVANAKTAKQAEADWILGIGKTHDTALEYVRHLQLCKNKLAGDEDTDPLMRHGRADVLIEPQIARYKDL